MHPKILSLAFLLSLFFVSKNNAQSISIGFSGGPAISDLRFSNEFTDGLFDPALGFAASGNVTWRFSSLLGLRTGLDFNRKSGKADLFFTDENGEPIGEVTQREMFDFVSVPILFEASFGGKFRGIVQAGQSVGILLLHTTTFDNLPAMNGDDRVHRTDEFNRFEHTIIGGLGFETNLNEKVAFQFLLRPSYGLSNLNNSSPVFSNQEIRTFSVGGMLGLQLFLN